MAKKLDPLFLEFDTREERIATMRCSAPMCRKR